jgi:DNA-binding Lrp family transcriptional regulator
MPYVKKGLRLFILCDTSLLILHGVETLKETELRLIAELMKDSHRSDRELARALHISQPTVTRIRRKLEKQGIIKEYTMIPDFSKLGFAIMGSTRFQMNETPVDDSQRACKGMTDKYAGFMGVQGVCEGRNRLLVSFYENYSEYCEALKFLKANPVVNVDNVDTFMVDLRNKALYRVLSMAPIANYLLERLEREKKQKRKEKTE